MNFSRRANWNTPTNRLTLARQLRGSDVLDLTETNPTRAAIDYPLDALADAMARGSRAMYSPDPRGLISAREALAGQLRCSPDDLVLTASTSEAYAFLFKLLCDPGDAIAMPAPSYPLLEHLSALESVSIRPYPLEFHRRWEISSIPKDVRLIVIINPNNPTGSFVSASEQDAIAKRGQPIISDEVFLDYPLEGSGRSLVRDDILTFVLGGLSKSAGLPHFKLAWIRVCGPANLKRDAIAALELIADHFLSVSTPVQAALPDLLEIAPEIHSAIAARIRGNLDHLRSAAIPSVQVLPVEGGWSAVLRIPNTESDEDFALRLIERDGVAVHPGYFFDFETDGHLVISLLTDPGIFDEGVRRLLSAIPR
ncbi:MAG: pyridoxal phosphate-dependent aminotransferase [Acidobacteriota bacterium]|nr:pyridoxal phosphate-dependent aminotransferase [Acidobacteriota bacterium]